jgi:hypothetical protein
MVFASYLTPQLGSRKRSCLDGRTLLPSSRFSCDRPTSQGKTRLDLEVSVDLLAEDDTQGPHYRRTVSLGLTASAEEHTSWRLPRRSGRSKRGRRWQRTNLASQCVPRRLRRCGRIPNPLPEAGEGEPLVVLHGGGGVRHYTSHDLLAEATVILLEAPASAALPSMSDRRRWRTWRICWRSHREPRNHELRPDGDFLAAAGAAARCPTLRLCVALVLVAGAIRREAGPPASIRSSAHPERQAAQPVLAQEVVDKNGTYEAPDRHRAMKLEARMADLTIPVLVVFGTLTALCHRRWDATTKRFCRTATGLPLRRRA